jgi:hypothetical protein
MAVLFVNSFIFPILLIPFLALTVVSFAITLKSQQFFVSKQITFIFLTIVISIIVPVAKSNSLYDIKLAFFLVCSILFSYTLSSLKPIKSTFLCWLPLLISLVMFAFYAVNGRSAEDFFPLNSRNFVAVTLFLGLFSYFTLSKNFSLDGKVILFNFAICFFCIYAVGRAGIVLSLLLLVCNSSIYVMAVTQKFTKNSRMIIRGVLSIILLISCFSLINYLYTNDFLARIISRGMHDLSRKNIIKEYFSSIDGLSFILGVKLSDLELMVKFNNNLHNSYLSVHSSFGLFYSMFFIFLVTHSLVLCWGRKYYPLVFLLVIILARGVSDIQVLAGRGDWVFFFMIFYLIQTQRSQKKELHKSKILYSENS